MSEPDVTPSHSHSSPLNALTKKIGPLPGWAWVAIAVAAYAGYRWYSNRNGGGSAPTDTVILDPSSQPVSGDASSAGGGIGSGSVDTGGGSIITTTPVGPQTNAQWAATAARVLIAGGGDPVQTNNALTKYISRQGLTSAERSIVTKAISQLGPPPEGLIEVSSAATYSAMNPPKGTTYTHHTADNTYVERWPDGTTHKITHSQWVQLGSPKAVDDGTKPFLTYTTKKGDTFKSLATRYYGDGKYWTHIADWNSSLKLKGATGALPAGVVIRIPEGYGKLH